MPEGSLSWSLTPICPTAASSLTRSAASTACYSIIRGKPHRERFAHAEELLYEALKGDWTMGDYKNSSIKAIREKVVKTGSRWLCPVALDSRLQ